MCLSNMIYTCMVPPPNRNHAPSTSGDFHPLFTFEHVTVPVLRHTSVGHLSRHGLTDTRGGGGSPGPRLAGVFAPGGPGECGVPPGAGETHGWV